VRRLLLLAILGLSVPSSGTVRTRPIALSPSAANDLECFTLGLVAAGGANQAAKRDSAVAGLWYFLGRLDGEAPGIDLRKEADRALARMSGNPHTNEIGAACDAQFRNRSADLIRLGGRA